MKTWADVEEAARHDPLLRDLVTVVRMGALTRELALIQVVLAHQEIRERQFAEILHLRNTRLEPILVLPPGVSKDDVLTFKGKPVIWDSERNTTEVWPDAPPPSKPDPPTT